MRTLYAIYRKEMNHYFVSPLAWIVVGLFLGLSGYFFNSILSLVMQESLQQMMQGMRYGTPANFDVPGVTLRAFLGIISTMLLFITPLLTMGVYAEERKRGTMELLMTSPVSDTRIVLGKFLGLLTLYAIMLLPTMLYVSYVFMKSDPRAPFKLILVGYLGALLLGGALLAIGSFLSSLTENQLISGFLAFAIFLILWVLDWGQQSAGDTKGAILGYLSITKHYEDFTRGVVDTSSLVFYCSLIILALFLTVRSLDSMRWRRA
jgi:ABC-2 type transport system permease protein